MPEEILSNRIKELSDEVLKFSRDCLMVNLRFMDAAVSRLALESRENAADVFSSDGRKIVYNPRLLLKAYKEEKNLPTRDYLHTVFHCVFGHIFIPEIVVEGDIGLRLWNLSCDIAVEYSITGLGQSTLTCRRQQRQEKVFAALAPLTGMLTAEKIYKYYAKNPLPEDELQTLEETFRADGHSSWMETGKTDESLKSTWLSVSRRMQIDMETFARRQAGKAGALMQSLKETNRETSDYSAFLSTFAIKGDGMKLDPDEFDMVTYSYGMQMSGGKVPIVEPTEYKDSMRVRDFVLAIETVNLDVLKIKNFVRETMEIFHATENYFSKVRLHVLDGGETLITCFDELTAYLEKFEGPADDCIVISESGKKNVDSRAVFNRVSEMRRQNRFKNLRGLLVFTDTDVIYPASMPAFKTVFVFVNDDYSIPAVPPWGIRQVLELDEI